LLPFFILKIFRTVFRDLPVAVQFGELQADLEYVIGVPTVGREADISYVLDTLD